VMKPKTKYPPAGGFSAALLMTGEAELAVQQKPELLHVAGAEIIGFLPGDLNLVTHFAAGITSGCKNAGAAKDLISFLRMPDSKSAFQAKGLEPA
jgi:molybdate transport system substrate-binding protein